MTHMARIRYIFQSAIHFQKNPQQKNPPKPLNKNHPTNTHKTFHGVFERYHSFRKKIKTDVVISRNCRAAWVTTCGVMYNLTLKFKIFAKNLEPFSFFFFSHKKSFAFQKRFLDSRLFMVNKQEFGYPGFAWLAKQNLGYFQIIYSSYFSSSKRYSTQL